MKAAGFKEFVREGLTLRSAEVPRVDIVLELGAVTDSVTVSGAATLLNTENVVSSYVLPAEVLKEVPGVMKRTVYLMQYMPGIVAVQSQAGDHIVGQAQNDIGATLDGITAKSPYTGVVNQVDGVVQGSTDAMEEVKVLTTGVSAEYGHSAGGSMKMVYKSGTNSLHGSFEDRYLNGKWVHRGYLTQTPLPKDAPWYYETFDLVVSGPLVIPKLYNGRNKTFWLSDYAINHEHTINQTVGTVPTEAMLNGDFSFADAPGGGLPIYNPFSTRLVGTTWTRDPLPGNIVPKNLFDPVAVKFLALGIWNKPNQVGTPDQDGPVGESAVQQYLPVPPQGSLGREGGPPVLLEREDFLPLFPVSQSRPERRQFRPGAIQRQPGNQSGRRHQRRHQLHLHLLARDVQRVPRSATIAAPIPIRRVPTQASTTWPFPALARRPSRTSTSATASPRWATRARWVRTG